MATQIKQPPAQPSDEAKQKGLELARKQGDAYGQALEYMVKDVAHGSSKRAVDYEVAYAVENAEGLYRLVEGQLEWVEPRKENAHIEIAVRDAADGRFIPELQVHVTVLDDKCNIVDSHEQPFLWHPTLYHYGLNWTLPREGDYTLRVHIEPPHFMRHDKINGRRYTEAVDVEFQNVHIETGQKKS